MEDNKPLVAIHCLVYNHEPYLRDCFDGFVKQRTNFPFVAIVHDDASTDGSAAIIREYEEKYPHIFKPIYETENQYSKKDGSIRRIMRKEIDATKAKYVAMCEGDDYWIDTLKLQKQVDFMESHPSYVLCSHRYKIYNYYNSSWYDDGLSEVFADCKLGKEFTNIDNFENWMTKTMTLLIRREAFDSILINDRRFKFWRDVHLNYYLLKKSVGYILPFVGAVYRRHSHGVYSSLSEIEKRKINLRIFNELAIANKDDNDFVDFYVSQHYIYRDMIRNKIYSLQFTNVLSEIIFLLDIDYNFFGVKGVLLSLKKLTSTSINTIFRK